MKFTSVLILVIAFIVAITSVSATPYRETNGERFARGLPPLPPQKRSGTPVYGAKRSGPSGSPGQCSTGTPQCCDSTGFSTDPLIEIILELLGVIVDTVDTLLGVNCAAYDDTCSGDAVCCTKSQGDLCLACTALTT